MHRPNHNKRVVNLDKVQWSRLFYENQEGLQVSHKPKHETVHGMLVHPSVVAAYHPNYPCETMLERARRLEILDIWEPVCIVQLIANRRLHYTGKKALSIWKAWCKKVYGK